MKAIAVYPGQINSVHLADLRTPSLDEIPNGRGVLVRLLRCGVDGTDKEINAAGIRDLAMAEAQYSGWVAQLLTHPVQGLDNFRELIDTLTSGKNVIKVFCEIAPLDSAVDTGANNRVAYAR